MNTSRLVLLTVVTAVGGTSAQSASVTLNASSDTVAPGESITIDPDVGGAGGGVFGPAGLYGFGGEINFGGAGAADVSASSASILASLPSGSTVTTGARQV